VLRECIESAEPYPITGLYRARDYAEEYWALYGEDQRHGVSTGWPSLDEFMTIAVGQLTVVTGIPNHGKSEFLDALLVGLAKRNGWHVALCSFENQPPEHLTKLAEKHQGLPFRDGPTRRMTRTEAKAALDWLDQHFFFGQVKRFAQNHDPYNEMEHRRPFNMTETEFISQMRLDPRTGPRRGPALRQQCARRRDVHVFIVAHPAKPVREGGKVSVPTLYDIAGSANWANKADIGLAVHRPDFDRLEVEIHVHKVREKWIGKPGGVTLRYNNITGRYFEPEAVPAGTARGYRDD
jgi:twinkle protein